MPWITRGLREGIVTSRYPWVADDYGPGFRAVATVIPGSGRDDNVDASLDEAVAVCPTRAIEVEGSDVRLDRGRCIACGRCAEAAPRRFAFQASPEVSVLRRDLLVVPERSEEDDQVAILRENLGSRVRALRRSVHLRHIDCGSDGTEEWEIAALTNPVYDVQRLGIFFTASPRHADILLVTGAGSAGMVEPLLVTYDSMPSPKAVIGIGTDALSGGLFSDSYATHGGVQTLLPLDVFVPGSPPSPFAILHGILLGIGLLPMRATR